MVAAAVPQRTHPERESSPLVVFAGGGTGGHLYPAISLAEALERLLPGVRFRFLGTRRPIDRRLLSRGDYNFVQQPLVALRAAPWKWPRILLGFRQARRLCRDLFISDPPAVVIGTGGLGCFPAVREAVRLGIPTVLLNPDALPGRANRMLADSVDVVVAQWQETVGHFRRSTRVVVLGCPVRAAISCVDRNAGMKEFGLDPSLKTLLITGASQGARTINQAVLASLGRLERVEGWQVLHLTGEADFQSVQSAYASRAIRATLLPYTDKMPEALAAADLIVARAGASSLAEFTAVGKASILMPYPFHRDHHQVANAECLARRRAALVLLDQVDAAVNGPALARRLNELMGDDDRREAMSQAAREMGKPEAAAATARHVLELVGFKVPAVPCESLETLEKRGR